MARKSRLHYIGVAPCVPLGARGKEWYTYAALDTDNVAVGSVVRIPFGKQTVSGVVMALDLQKPSYPTKIIQRVTPICLTDVQMQFAHFIADSAHGGFGFTARLFLPNSFTGLASVQQDSLGKREKSHVFVIIEKKPEIRHKHVYAQVKKISGQSLILVPEISMLAEYEHVFAEECKNNSAALYHAGLSTKQKKDIWQRVASGEITIVIGTQKSLFLPFINLACVCVTEEYIESYKLWDQYPRLDTVLAAEHMARMANAQLVYASSYPSVKLRHLMQEKKCQTICDHPVIPRVAVYGFSFEDRKWKRAVPDELSRPIRSWARSGKKVLVLHNKKDHAVVRTSLLGKLSKKAISNITISTVGILSDPQQEKFDEVVWLQPELTLRSIDYRSSERARGIVARLMAICANKQIYVAARYAEFVREQLEVPQDVWLEKTLKDRKRFLLPPYADLVRLTIRDKKEKAAHTRAEDVRGMLDESIHTNDAMRVYGPYQELGKQKKELFEYQVVLSGALDELVPMYKNLPIDSADVAPHRIV